MFKDLQGKGLLIHHWDTDGICSARLILEYLSDKDIRNVTPILGNYFLTDDELEEYSKYDFVIVADMSLPEENILKLAEEAKVYIFDHHLGKEIKQVHHYNPIIKGENPNKFPSASWIINSFLEKPVNIYAILGIIGDHEQKIKKNEEFSKIIEDFCKQNNLEFDELLKMAYLIDTNYKLGDKKAVEEAPIKLLRYGSPDDILHNDIWNENYEKLNKEIQSILDLPDEDMDGIIFKKINTPYNIISTITRKIAWSSGKNTLVVNTGFFDDKDQIYMRSNKDAEPMIKRGKDLGFKCGGKKEVLGAIVSKNKTNSFVKELLEFMK
ncbi:MAG: DHH family phosphoesterase [Candidatus Heimdallarchaeaceae archaeon]